MFHYIGMGWRAADDLELRATVLMVGTLLGWGAAAPIVSERLLVLLGLSMFCYGIYSTYVKPWLVQKRKKRDYGRSD